MFCFGLRAVTTSDGVSGTDFQCFSGPRLEARARRLIGGLAAAFAICFTTAAWSGEYAPLDCGKAKTTATHAICNNYSLGQAEARMATLFGVATSLVPMGQRGNLIDTQHEWLRGRETCRGNTACLANAYKLRIQQLDAVISNIAAHGPF